jgi:hypothetical protein
MGEVMLLEANPNYKVLEDKERITKHCICYGRKSGGGVGWCGPGDLVGKKWRKYSLNSPSIVMGPIKRAKPPKQRKKN